MPMSLGSTPARAQVTRRAKGRSPKASALAGVVTMATAAASF